MKLVINYDFFNAIKDVKEPYGVLKVVRNNSGKYIRRLPIWGTLNYIVFQNMYDTLGALMCQYMLIFGSDLLVDKAIGIDTYATKAMNRLKKLVGELDNINVKTSYDLLLDSELYEKNYRIEFNDSKIPFLLEEKYILVPSYSYSGEVRDTSILQEHEVGTENYVLSVQEPVKKYKLVLSNC